MSVIESRKEAEEHLYERTRVNQIFLDNFPCVAMLIRPETREIVAANAVAIAAGVVVGQTCYESWARGSEPCSWCVAPELWATGQRQQKIVEIAGCFFDTYWIPISDDLYMHYAFDITERKNTEQQIESLAKFPSENPSPVLRVSRDGVLLYANEASVEILEEWGIREGDSVPDQLQMEIQEVFTSGSPKRVESEYGGKVFAIIVMPIQQADYANLYAFDITERKKSAESLKQSEERFRRAVIDSPFPIMIHADDGEVLQISRVWTDLTGYRHEEIPTLSKWTARAYGEKKDVVKSRIDKIFEYDTRVSEGEYVISTKSGETLVWDFHSAPLGKLPDGRRLVISMAMDVTERKRAEEQLHFHQEELAHVARVATAGEMASGIAHEINQPLCAITNFADSCLRMSRSGKMDPAKLDDALEQIASQAHRAGKVINHLKNLIQKQPVQYSMTSIKDIVSGVLVLIDNDAKRRGVDIKLELNGKLPKVHVDSILIQQVILNLISNSFDAMDDVASGKRKLAIVAKKTNDDKLEIMVSDTGKGLNASDADKIFDPFYTTKSDGLGMGLSISKTIIKSHFGRLWATGNPKGGTVFHFTLTTRSKPNES